MARRVKPRWGWDHTHDTEDFSKREARVDIDWLAEQLDCKNEEQFRDIQWSVISLLLSFYRAQFEDFGPSNDEVRAALSEVTEAAATLSENLQRLDTQSRRLLSHGYQELHDSKNHGFAEDDFEHSACLFLEHHSATSDARFIMDTKILEAAIATLDLPVEKKSRGPRPKMAIKGLIEDIAALIEEYCQQDALEGFYLDAIQGSFRGKLVEILEHILDRFAPDLNTTNSAIGGQIRRTMGDLPR